ncbi:MAG: DUF624 domain-containing protein [Clostridia bacterium]|nr:DUF624 domain-containing protein [Clostridia bacterium]
MSGIMNNYFYGKAGQADYTVEQMPTNRKQLFFTTLKVRFSSMVGINLLHFVFMLPLLLWLFLGYQALNIYAGLDVYDAPEVREQLREVAPEIVSEYEAFEALDAEFNSLVSKYGSAEKIDALFEAGEKVILDKTDETGNTVQDREIAQDYWNDQLKTARAEHYRNYANGLIQQRNGNIVTTLLIAIPLFAIASLGRPGMMYVLRNWARDEHSFVWQDYKDAIKANWKQSLPLGLLNGLSFLLFFVAWTFYGEQANSNWIFAIPQGLMLVILIVWWMMNEVIYVMMVTYDMKLFTLIRNSILMVIARLPIAFLILLGTVAFPLLLMFVPAPYNLLALLLVYLFIGFAFVGFVQASFANSCFDKYLNPRIEGAEVNKGLYNPDEDEKAAEAEDTPKELVKEDRYWEHKTRK